MGRRLITAAVMLLFWPGVRVLAHPVPFSYLDLRLQSGAIEGTLVVHVLDVAHDLAIDPGERAARSGVRGAFVRRASRSSSAGGCSIDIDGVATPIEWTRLEVAAERQSLRLHFRVAVGRRRVASMRVVRHAVSVRRESPDVPERLRRRRAHAGDSRPLAAVVRVLRRHAPGRVRGRAQVPAVRRASHPDRSRPSAVPDRPAAARAARSAGCC